MQVGVRVVFPRPRGAWFQRSGAIQAVMSGSVAEQARPGIRGSNPPGRPRCGNGARYRYREEHDAWPTVELARTGVFAPDAHIAERRARAGHHGRAQFIGAASLTCACVLEDCRQRLRRAPDGLSYDGERVTAMRQSMSPDICMAGGSSRWPEHLRVAACTTTTSVWWSLRSKTMVHQVFGRACNALP